MPSAAQDGETVVAVDIVVMIEVVGTVVAVTMVGIIIGGSHGSACVVLAGATVVDVFHGSMREWSVYGGRLIGDRFIDAETAGYSPRRFSSSLCRSSAKFPSIGRLLFINSSVKPSLFKW